MFSINEIEEPEELRSIADHVLQQPSCGSNLSQDNNGTIAVTVFPNALYTKGDAVTSGKIAVAEAARKVICAGGTPSVVALNFDNSDQLKGAEQASTELGIAITNGSKASLGATVVGTIDGLEVTPEFKMKGDLIFLLGDSVDDISSSIYAASYHKVAASPAPFFDLIKEAETQAFVKELVKQEIINAAHSVGAGGLYTTLVEMAMPRELGFDVEADGEVRLDAFLFGEAQGRMVVAVNEMKEDEFIEYIATVQVPSTLIGHVTKGKLVVDGEPYGFIQDAKGLYNNAIAE